jgi:sigma-B regulation protein RsbU (phosphoserine phosphatase)
MESFRLITHDIGQTLSSSMDSTQVEETLLKLAMKDTVADGAALYKVGGESGELILSLSAGRFRPPYTVSDLPDSPEEEDINAILRSRIIQPGKTMLGESATQGRGIILRDIEHSEETDWSRPVGDALYISSIIVVPLLTGSTVFGVIAITSSEPGILFSDLEFANMQSFGELAAITLDNIYKYTDLLEVTQLNRELGIAEEIQNDLLPKRLPRLPGGEVAIMSRSIKGLNGDYYDVFPIGEGKTLVTICEVAGKGVPAGLVMVMIRTILRLVASPDKDARAIMTLLNRDMTRQIAIESYASVGILIVDAEGNFTFSSAAHYPLQILRSDASEFEALQTEGIPVGIDRNTGYKQQAGKLSRNDLVMFHTDGIPESRNRSDKAFGIENLLDIISSESEKSPEKIVETLKVELEFFERGTEQRDDQTVIILKYTGSSAA